MLIWEKYPPFLQQPLLSFCMNMDVFMLCISVVVDVALQAKFGAHTASGNLGLEFLSRIRIVQEKFWASLKPATQKMGETAQKIRFQKTRKTFNV